MLDRFFYILELLFKLLDTFFDLGDIWFQGLRNLIKCQYVWQVISFSFSKGQVIRYDETFPGENDIWNSPICTAFYGGTIIE